MLSTFGMLSANWAIRPIAEQINLAASQAWFVPGSQLKALWREIIEQLTVARVTAHPKGSRKAVHEPAPAYPDKELSSSLMFTTNWPAASTNATAWNSLPLILKCIRKPVKCQS